MKLDIELFKSHLDWMEGGTVLFGEGLSRLDLQDHDRRSLLGGWSVAQLIAHVNSNARALVNLTLWARTGVENPMYQSNDQRANDIAEGAKQPLDVLVDDFLASSREFSDGLASLSTQQLDYQVKSARGRDIPVSEAVWIRIREVWIHAVDLGVGIGFARFPFPLLDAIMDDVVPSLATRSDPPQLLLVAIDVSKTWRTMESENATKVEGSQADLVAWLLGRSEGQGLIFGTPRGLPPTLSPWL